MACEIANEILANEIQAIEMDAEARRILDGEMPDMVAGDAVDEEEMMRKILDGEITFIADPTAQRNVNIATAELMQAKDKLSDEQAEIARKILNGEMPE